MKYDAFSGHHGRCKLQEGGVCMERIPKSMFTEKFKEEAVRMSAERGLIVSGAANRLSIGKSMLGRWVKEVGRRCREA